MSVKQFIEDILFSESFDPFDLSQLQPPPPETFCTLDSAHKPPVEPFEGFRESMQLLGDDLKRGLKIYAKQKK